MTIINEKSNPPAVDYKRSRLEINIRLLLNKCELIAKQEAIDSNSRLKTYVESLSEMLTELKTSASKPPKDVLAEYTKRTGYLKGLIETSNLSNPIDKLEAAQRLPHGAATHCADAAAQEIHQRTLATYGTELRTDLFGKEEESDGTRRRRGADASAQQDVDSLLKYHQDMQEKVAENMVLLTRSLKEQSQIASTIIKRDTEALKKSSEMTERNMDSLRAESTRLQEHSRAAWKCWLWIMLAVVIVIFINMVLFMKVMKKRKY